MISMSQIVFYFRNSTSTLSFYVDVVLTLSILYETIVTDAVPYFVVTWKTRTFSWLRTFHCFCCMWLQSIISLFLLQNNHHFSINLTNTIICIKCKRWYRHIITSVQTALISAFNTSILAFDWSVRFLCHSHKRITRASFRFVFQFSW